MDIGMEKFLNDILEVAYDAVKNDFGVGGISMELNEAMKKNPIASVQFAARYSTVIALSAVINYHMALRTELQKHGIDIGSFCKAAPPSEPSDSDQ